MEKMLKVKELASNVGEDPMTIYKRIRVGEIAVVRIGKRGIRIKESEVERWLETSGEK